MNFIKYVIGIDAGGTKTNLKIANIHGDFIYEAVGDSGNINSTKTSFVLNNFTELINKSLTHANLSKEDCKSICLGAAGGDRENDKNDYLKIFNTIGFEKNILVVNDAKIAMFANATKPNRMLLISGTGSICYGENENGDNFRSGGFGHILGDYGSGYFIGNEGLKNIIKLYDSNMEKTILSELILDYFNIKNESELINVVYKSNNIKKIVAEISKIVYEAYTKGDVYSKQILIDATNHLYELVRLVHTKIGYCKDIQLIFAGSVLEKAVFVRESLTSIVKEKLTNVEVIQKSYESVDGAIKLAIQNIK